MTSFINHLDRFLELVGVDNGDIAWALADMPWEDEEDRETFLHVVARDNEPFPTGMAPDVAWGAREHTPALEVYPGGQQPAQIHTGPRPMPTAAERIATNLRGGIEFDTQNVDVTGVRDARPWWAPTVQSRLPPAERNIPPQARVPNRREHQARVEGRG